MTPTVFALVVGAAGVLATQRTMLAVLMICCLFGAAAAINLPALGGATITPAVFAVPFVVACALREKGLTWVVQQVAYPSAGFWLLMLTVWGVVGGFFLPRIFSGDVLVYTSNRDAESASVAMLQLKPVSGNLTQAGYALGSVIVYVAVRTLIDTPSGLKRFRNAVILLAALNCIAAAINLAELYAGFPPVLEFVRNAGYAMLNRDEVSGLARITGTFPEASAFSAFTLPLLAFTWTLWMNDVRALYTGALAAASLVLLLLSTSNTAYVALAAYAACAGIVLAWRGVVRGEWPKGRLLAAGAVLAVLACSSAVVFDLPLVRSVSDFFDVTVFDKLSSSSGAERSAWNLHAWSNFTDTYGMGVGLGSARASSYPLVLLSNVGAVGTLFFVLFVGRLLLVRAPAGEDRDSASVRSAARHALLATLIAASASAGVFDLGVAFYACCAAAAAPPLAAPVNYNGRGCLA